MLGRLLNSFVGSEPLAIHAGNSRVRALPASARLEIMERLKSIAPLQPECPRLRLQNPDISSGSCHISGRWPPAARESSQLGLFPRSNKVGRCSCLSEKPAGDSNQAVNRV